MLNNWTILGVITVGIICVRGLLGFRQDYVYVCKKSMKFKEYWKNMYNVLKKGA